MDKIRELLTKSGVSEEAASKICESLDTFRTEVKEQYDAEFTTRLQKAKQVCLEETNAHKAELSRRVQIFLEAKNTAIEQSLLRSSAQRETEAAATLEKIASLVEGIEPNGQSCSELKTELAKYRRITESIAKERDAAMQKAKRLTGISERVLAQNRALERRIAEGQEAPAKPNGQVKRIDEDRSKGKPQTTRRTIKETVEPPQPQRESASNARRVGSMTAPKTPDDIAGVMEDI